MFFGFTDDQLAFRDALRDLLADACPPAAVRAVWQDGGPGYDPKLWAQLEEMGVLGLLAPPERGGLGLDEVDLILLIEECGRAAMPGPLVEHAMVGVPLLSAAGLDVPPVITFGERAERVGWGEVADLVLIVDGGAVRAVRPDAVSALDCVDRSRRDAAISWSGGDVIDADAALALDRAVLGTAAQLCGLAARMIAMTVDYAGARHQFGVPIGSYQAVKHHLANALLRLEHARPAVYRAAHTVARRGPDRARDVSMAFVMAAGAADVAGRASLQCHGAIGYTWEHDLHLWLKRTWVLTRSWGGVVRHRERVAAAII